MLDVDRVVRFASRAIQLTQTDKATRCISATEVCAIHHAEARKVHESMGKGRERLIDVRAVRLRPPHLHIPSTCNSGVRTQSSESCNLPKPTRPLTKHLNVHLILCLLAVKTCAFPLYDASTKSVLFGGGNLNDQGQCKINSTLSDASGVTRAIDGPRECDGLNDQEGPLE